MSRPDPEWLSYEEARHAILSHVSPLETETTSLERALGRALAEDVVSPIAHPPWDNSAMDGFAVRAADVAGATASAPIVLAVSDDVPAGRFPTGPLRPGTAVRITTGAPVPDGATGVIRVEHTDGGPGARVTVFAATDAERNIRRAGEDVTRGEMVAARGSEATPAVIGILAMTGHARVVVHRRPRIGVLANGDELADFDQLDQVIAGRRIMNSNSYALAAQLADAGADAVALGIARDDPADVREKLEGAANLDAIISTAGVSVGEHDHVKAALADLGMERVFWRARIRPGSPLSLGLLDGRPVWSLPGNPVSAMVTFEIFLRPAIRKMAGHARPFRRSLRAIAGEDIRSAPGLTHFLRARASGRARGLLTVVLTGPQGSGILTSMSAADGLAIIPEDVERLERGAELELLPLRDYVGGDAE